MSTVSDQQWLRQIGVNVTADTDTDTDTDSEDESVSDDAVELDDDPDTETDDGPYEFEDTATDDAREPLSDPAPARPVDDGDDDDDGDTNVRPRRYTPWVLGAFGGVAVVATIATALGVMLSGPDAPPTPVHPSRPAPAPSLAAAPTTASPDTEDRPLPFTARSDCAGGSTSANSIADPDHPSPWICVRHTDGQPLYITLGPAGIEHSYVITAVCIVPGDTAPAQGSGGDPWLQHRVVSLLTWRFNDVANTGIPQTTGDVHGEACQPVSNISASKITVIIRQTTRPVAPTPTPTSAPDSGPFSGILGGPPGSPTDPSSTGQGTSQDRDPSDGTFAVSGIKIIGHKAQ
jgi:hypothetical protein